MKLEIESFWTLTAFGGTRTVFMHWKDGGDYVESLNPFEAERFRSKKELADYLRRDESASCSATDFPSRVRQWMRR